MRMASCPAVPLFLSLFAQAAASRPQELQATSNARLALGPVDPDLVAHGSALLHRFTKYNMSDDEIHRVLAEKQELHAALAAHRAHLKSEKIQGAAYKKLVQLRHELRQRARNHLKDTGMKLDASTGGKTQCRCFVEKVGFMDSRLKLDDLDSEDEDGDCEHTCLRACGNDEAKYKLDSDQATTLGIDTDGYSMKVAQCKGGCKCLDVLTSVERIENANIVLTYLAEQTVQLDVVKTPCLSCGLNEAPNEYSDEVECLERCNCNDFDYGDIDLDLEGMCVDEWR